MKCKIEIDRVHVGYITRNHKAQVGEAAGQGRVGAGGQEELHEIAVAAFKAQTAKAKTQQKATTDKRQQRYDNNNKSNNNSNNTSNVKPIYKI